MNNKETVSIGIAADYGGYELKVQQIAALTFTGYQIPSPIINELRRMT